MTTINYKFADGHTENIEVTEEFASQYKILEEEQKRYEEREKKRRRRQVSFERMVENGYDFQDYNTKDPLEILIEKEQEENVGNIIELSDFLTERQRYIMELYYEVGYTKTEISHVLHVDESTVRKCLQGAIKKILKNF